MKPLILSAVLLGAGAFAVSAQAQQWSTYPESYLGGDAMWWELDPDGSASASDDFGLRLRGGVQFNELFAVEGHLGTGGSDGDVSLEYLVGAYAKGILPIAPELRVYGLAGVTEVDFDVESESDFSYGVGGEFDMTPNLALGADYMRYLDNSDQTFDAASVGLRFRF